MSYTVLKVHQEFDAIEGPVGRDPRNMTLAELADAGFDKPAQLDAIRANCIACCSGSFVEVRRCPNMSCPVWPFRMGVNPWRRTRSLAQRSQALGNLARLAKTSPKLREKYPTTRRSGSQGEVGTAIGKIPSEADGSNADAVSAGVEEEAEAEFAD